MTPRIQKAIDIFLDAINNNTLIAGNPCGCAVGNLVAHEMGITLSMDKLIIGPKDCEDLPYKNGEWFDMDWCKPGHRKILDNKQSRSTGFTIDELTKIEEVFEDHSIYSQGDLIALNSPKEKIREWQIHALEAVIKVMLTFDEQKDDVKEVFTNKAELIPVC